MADRDALVFDILVTDSFRFKSYTKYGNKITKPNFQVSLINGQTQLADQWKDDFYSSLSSLQEKTWALEQTCFNQPSHVKTCSSPKRKQSHRTAQLKK